MLQSFSESELFGGLEWRCTTDPRQAIPIFAEFQPDLVLIDLYMPHLDGYQVMEQIKRVIREDEFLPIVVLTADVTPETRRKALFVGASDFMTKPLDTTEVLLRLRNLLESRFLNQKLETQVRQRSSGLGNAIEQVVKPQANPGTEIAAANAEIIRGHTEVAKEATVKAIWFWLTIAAAIAAAVFAFLFFNR
ncbi:hypothetical protein LBMAG57_19720 [Verrucomicrobiota bacterium]|nr:hypothetical protein LBMAG57_19720 [Verrucomicrobiota bacterium]